MVRTFPAFGRQATHDSNAVAVFVNLANESVMAGHLETPIARILGPLLRDRVVEAKGFVFS